MNQEQIIDNAFHDELEKLSAPKWITRLGGAIGGARAKSKALKGVEKQINKEWKLLNKQNPLHGHVRTEWLDKRRTEVLKEMAGDGKSFLGKHKGKIALGLGAASVYALAKNQTSGMEQPSEQQIYPQ